MGWGQPHVPTGLPARPQQRAPQPDIEKSLDDLTGIAHEAFVQFRNESGTQGGQGGYDSYLACEAIVKALLEGLRTVPFSACWFHGVEIIPSNVYRVCFECSHVWTQEALIEADATHRDHAMDASDIHCCPLCIHDW